MDIRLYALIKAMVKSITKGDKGDRGDTGLPYIIELSSPAEGYELYNNCEYHITPGSSLALDLNFDLTWDGSKVVASDSSRGGQIVVMFTVSDDTVSIAFPENVVWASADPVYKVGVTYMLSFVPCGDKIIGVWATA